MIKKFLTKKAFYIAAAVILASAVLCVCYLRSRAPGYDNLTRKEDLITRQYAPETVERLAQKIEQQEKVRYFEVKRTFRLECVRKTYQGYYAVLQLTDGRNAFIFMDDQLIVSNVAIYDCFRTKEEFEKFLSEKWDATWGDVLLFDSNGYGMPVSVVTSEAHIVQEGAIVVIYRREGERGEDWPVDHIRFYSDSEITAGEMGDWSYFIKYSVPHILEIDRVNQVSRTTTA